MEELAGSALWSAGENTGQIDVITHNKSTNFEKHTEVVDTLEACVSFRGQDNRVNLKTLLICSFTYNETDIYDSSL